MAGKYAGALVVFEVWPDDGDLVVIGAGSRDVAVWERSGKGRTLTSWQTNPKTEDTYRVCWIALERAEARGLVTIPDGIGDWQQLMALCDVVSITPEQATERYDTDEDEDDAEVGPTRTAP